jgi:sucrose phosphorylase
LAGENDMSLLEKTRVGRDINRHYYTLKEIRTSLQRPVVQRLIALIEFRNSHAAFNGQFSSQNSDANGGDHSLTLRWDGASGDTHVKLYVNFATHDWHIESVESAHGAPFVCFDGGADRANSLRRAEPSMPNATTTRLA